MVVNLPRGNQVQVAGRPTVNNTGRQAQAAQNNAQDFSSNADNISTGSVQTGVLPIATTTSPGIVQPDGTTILVDPTGVISTFSSGGGSGFHPGYVVGKFYGPPGFLVTNATLAASTTTVYLTAFYVGVQQTFTKATVRSNSAASTTHVTMGLYANLNGEPTGAPLFNFGDKAIGSTTAIDVTISGLTIPLAPGWYWLAVGVNAASTLQGLTANPWPTGWFQGSSSTTSNAAGGYFLTWTYSAGNLPTIGTITATAGVVPLVFLSY